MATAEQAAAGPRSPGEGRIARAFAKRPGRAALMPYLMGGFPDLAASRRIGEAYAEKLAKELGPGKNMVINISGRGDKDIGVVAEHLSIDAREAEEASGEQ